MLVNTCSEHRAHTTTVGRGRGECPEAYLTHIFAKGLTVGCTKDFKLDVGIRAVLPKLHHPCEASDVALQREEKTIVGWGKNGWGREWEPKERKKKEVVIKKGTVKVWGSNGHSIVRTEWLAVVSSPRASEQDQHFPRHCSQGKLLRHNGTSHSCSQHD